MSAQQNNFYATWWANRPVVLHDAGAPPERLLQAIWRHQRLRRDTLRVADGRVIRVLHPGFLNRESGPDFRDAIIQFVGEPPQSGDVEVDIVPSAWHGHGHDRNPAFSRVVLHVVWRGADSNGLPTLALADVLDVPIEELADTFSGEGENVSPANMLGRCNAPLKELSNDHLDALLCEASLVRLRLKASGFAAIARQAGWEQALWRGLFRVLGYKQNAWPMQRIAELLPAINDPHSTLHSLQARLLGVAGLLPTELPRRAKSSNDYVRRLWDVWWREREQFAEHSLPRSIWRLSGLRPVNHPARRLALAAHWIAGGKLARDFEAWFAEAPLDSTLTESLGRLLRPETDEFWSWHLNLNSSRLPKPQPLLGATRVTDLAMNAVLPWFHARAMSGGNESAQREVERRWFAWPASEDNAVLKLTRQRLFAAPRRLRSAAQQQGLLQIARDFCSHSNALCEHCPFPDLVKSWTVANATLAH